MLYARDLARILEELPEDTIVVMDTDQGMLSPTVIGMNYAGEINSFSYADGGTLKRYVVEKDDNIVYVGWNKHCVERNMR